MPSGYPSIATAASLGGRNLTVPTDLIRALRGSDGARFLKDKYLVFRPHAPTEAIDRLAVLLLTAGVDAVLIIRMLDKLDTDERGYLALMTLG